MRLIVITKQDLLQALKYSIAYFAMLLLGALTGLLPLVALVSGVPFLLLGLRSNARTTQIAETLCITLTWFMLDITSFYIVGLGLAIAHGLLLTEGVRDDRFGLGFGMFFTGISGFIWTVFANLITYLLTGATVLAVFKRDIEQAVSLVHENMLSLNLYTAEQAQELLRFGEEIVVTLSNHWGYILFVFAFVSALASLLLTQLLQRSKFQPFHNWTESKAHYIFGVLTILLGILNYFLPETALSGLIGNLWSIFVFYSTVSGFVLCAFYAKHLRFSRIIKMFATIYLLLNPIAWRVLFLVGLFDSFFDYRYYARQQKEANKD